MFSHTRISLRARRSAARGFTLLELLVVLSILALLAALVIPKVTDMFERSRSATQAYSIGDIARQLEIYSSLNHKYPDGWDSLMDATGAAIYTKLAPEVEAPNSFFTTVTLTDDQITSLSSAGVSHVFLHDAASPASNSGNDRRHFGSGTGHDGTANVNMLVAIDKSYTSDSGTTTYSDGLNLLVESFGLNANRSAGDTTLTRINANTYVVLGLGPRSTLVQTQVHEAPLLEHATSASNYSRAFAVFEVPNVGTVKAKLVGVFGPDGRTKSVAISDFNSPVVQPH